VDQGAKELKGEGSGGWLCFAVCSLTTCYGSVKYFLQTTNAGTDMAGFNKIMVLTTPPS